MTEKYKRFVLFILCLMFFAIANECSGQTYYPVDPITFETSKGKIYLTVRSDVSQDTVIHRLFAYFTDKALNGYNLKISFCNGNFDVIPVVNAINGYHEYRLSADNIKNLSKYRFDTVFFDSKHEMFVCNQIPVKDYFLKHFNN